MVVLGPNSRGRAPRCRSRAPDGVYGFTVRQQLALIQSVRACGLPFEVLRNEIVHPQAHGPRGTVLVVALEVDRVLADYDLACLLEQEAVHLAVARRPGV